MEDHLKKILKEIEGKNFGSLEEIQETLNKVVMKRNQEPLDEFCGLSPEQMHRILDFPFDSPEYCRFSDSFPVPTDSPVFMLFSMLAEACGKQGLKTTAKGFLPQKFCMEAGETFYEKYPGQPLLQPRVRKELDFTELHALRLLAELAGLLRKYRKRFVLTKKCNKLLESGSTREIYMELFKAHTTKFNWAYLERYDDFYIIQRSFLFSLYILSKFGSKFRPALFYEEKFLRVFPMVLQEAPGIQYTSKEKYVGVSYTHRTMNRFAEFFGLVNIRYPDRFSFSKMEIVKTPLLDQLVLFNI